MMDSNHRGPVLFAYDGSEHAKAAITEAGRQLRNGRRAIVLTVWQPLAAMPFAAAPGVVTPPGPEADENEAQSVAQEGAGLVRSMGFDVEPLVERGSPIWRGIVDAADEHDAAIVVMGSHGRTGIPLVLLGSVAGATVRHTERPVLIAHAEQSEPGGHGDDAPTV
jgi:nucleotide-binding universal stress UspA family protein